ncbi:MAG TPA: peptidylprolyl isomerase [Pirellulaceae bacterium]|nr:peptidylprolyl isomerase [Pirellulaceae bacterium]HMO91842.1 peptidylprolyl isomerase [Pirellulaceae bacterium]HMP69905.1 peptidylprolyl isomerase [Pirellulaceae bacterium]
MLKELLRIGLFVAATFLFIASSLAVGYQDGTNDQNVENQDEQEQTGEAAAPQDDKPAASRLAQLKAEWAALNRKLDEQQIAFDEAAEGDREAIRKIYEELVVQAVSMVETIKQAAIDELEGQDKDEAIKTLLGIMINDATSGNDWEVLRVGQVLIDHGIEKDYFVRAQSASRLPLSAKAYFDELIARLEQKDVQNPLIKIETSKGDLVVELFEVEAPDTVGNFISLIEKGFYDGLTFHRVLENFMAQGGCPDGTGSGGPGYKIYCECTKENARHHFTGSLSMAHAGRNTGGSQFFICFTRTQHLDGNHTVFGRVIEGIEVLPKLQRINPDDPNKPDPDKIIKMEVIRKTEGKEYKPNKVGG